MPLGSLVISILSQFRKYESWSLMYRMPSSIYISMFILFSRVGAPRKVKILIFTPPFPPIYHQLLRQPPETRIRMIELPCIILWTTSPSIFYELSTWNLSTDVCVFNVLPAVCEILVFQQSGGGCIRHRRPAGWLLVVVEAWSNSNWLQGLQRLAKNYSAILLKSHFC